MQVPRPARNNLLLGSSLLLVNVTLAVFKPAQRLRARASEERRSVAMANQTAAGR